MGAIDKTADEQASPHTPIVFLSAATIPESSRNLFITKKLRYQPESLVWFGRFREETKLNSLVS